MKFNCLPEHNLWDSVRTTAPVTRRHLGARLVCRHAVTTEFVRVDTQPGPGWMSDSYEGTVCCDCGAVLSETKTY